ncbi:aerolysin-like protein [Papaver somniferum]|uniref:aerolysin-like protein n=1 Tax=Papaver somniferum TaxID=3469 RepID=UPI000E7050D8|nr:aerolysin-like protein [Papaver somniferum]
MSTRMPPLSLRSLFYQELSTTSFMTLLMQGFTTSMLLLANEEARNKKGEGSDTVKLNLKHTERYTREWTASVSFTLGVKVSLSVGVPEIAEGKVETSYEFKSSYEWGERNEDELEMGSEYTVTVPPMSSVKVSLMATRASCDIPFSYTQRDVLTNGTVKVYYKNDGIFKGRNAYNYRLAVALAVM